MVIDIAHQHNWDVARRYMEKERPVRNKNLRERSRSRKRRLTPKKTRRIKRRGGMRGSATEGGFRLHSGKGRDYRGTVGVPTVRTDTAAVSTERSSAMTKKKQVALRAEPRPTEQGTVRTSAPSKKLSYMLQTPETRRGRRPKDSFPFSTNAIKIQRI